MILNLGSLSFNADVAGGGGTPAWGTELGQGEGYKFSFENLSDFFTGMVYKSVPDIDEVTCPLGKGGNQSKDYDFVIASLFDKVYVNSKRVKDANFILLIVKKITGEHHVGRRTIKYNPRITYRGQHINEACFNKIPHTLGWNDDAAWFIHEINILNQDELHFTAYLLGETPQTYVDANTRKHEYLSRLPKVGDFNLGYRIKTLLDHKPIQQIIYGAPGTGKSFEICNITEQIDELTEANSEEPRVFRTTFHPDSDYSTFVGAYKPEKTKHPVRNVAGNVVIEDGMEVQEDIITYNFCPQAFAKAYIRAWQTKEPVILVIEEINRGNCAQIFGDLFQLLDRDGNNESKYPIDPDTDFGKFIAEKLEGFNVPELIKQGKKLKLPANLYIWATMNTSDQSLFPIDSAFKRRWEWRYIKIAQPKMDGTDEKFNWKIEGDVDWWQFVKKINDIIQRMTNSADKQLGYFFAKANNVDVITYDCFVSKVCFYLWNDIFKTYAVDGMENSLFKYTYIDEDDFTEKTGVLDFTKFFDDEGKVVPAIVQQFIENVMNWQSEAK